jgi:hypothetical protein
VELDVASCGKSKTEALDGLKRVIEALLNTWFPKAVRKRSVGLFPKLITLKACYGGEYAKHSDYK